MEWKEYLVTYILSNFPNKELEPLIYPLSILYGLCSSKSGILELQYVSKTLSNHRFTLLV